MTYWTQFFVHESAFDAIDYLLVAFLYRVFSVLHTLLGQLSECSREPLVDCDLDCVPGIHIGGPRMRPTHGFRG